MPFNADGGIVETWRILLQPDILTLMSISFWYIGGQDIKCFKIHNDSIDSIMLNEPAHPAAALLLRLLQSPWDTALRIRQTCLMAKAPVDHRDPRHCLYELGQSSKPEGRSERIGYIRGDSQ
jgi:hypothetical protein